MSDAPPLPIAVAVVRHAGRVLIGPRPPEVPLAGFWEFPGGKIRPGETPAEAAVRECREETGLEVRIDGQYPTILHRYEHGAVELHFFAASPLDPSQAVAAPFRWVAVGELRGYEFPPANAAVLRELGGSDG